MAKVRGIPFKKGKVKTGGRKKGTPNKFTSLKNMFLDVCHQIGDDIALKNFAEGHPKEFWRLIGIMLPRKEEISGPDGKPLEINNVKQRILTKLNNISDSSKKK